MSAKDLAEHFVSGRKVYSGVLLHVQRDVVRLPNGRESVREYIRHPGAVLAVPLFDDGRVLLERQFRYPLGRVFVELPAGKLEPGEEPLGTIQRELLEETGYEAARWRRLGMIHPGIGYSNEVIELWLAQGLVERTARLDEDEFLEVFDAPMAEAIEMVKDGRISDAKTVAALLWMKAFEEAA
ncbi:MAG: NUDIX hydrolase [Betaproteobacteria bacterium]|nr:NUDIX hydrolase [Betaproteobacteria bacterium]